jgi:hypothetical protein
MGNLITMLVNNGVNPLTARIPGFGTGYLHDYKSFEE